MIAGGQTEAHAQLPSTNIDYREPFDQGLTVHKGVPGSKVPPPVKFYM